MLTQIWFYFTRSLVSSEVGDGEKTCVMSVNRKDKPYFDIKLFALKNKPLTSVDIDLMTFYGVVCGLKREGYLVLGERLYK